MVASATTTARRNRRRPDVTPLLWWTAPPAVCAPRWFSVVSGGLLREEWRHEQARKGSDNAACPSACQQHDSVPTTAVYLDTSLTPIADRQPESNREQRGTHSERAEREGVHGHTLAGALPTDVHAFPRRLERPPHHGASFTDSHLTRAFAQDTLRGLGYQEFPPPSDLVGMVQAVWVDEGGLCESARVVPDACVDLIALDEDVLVRRRRPRRIAGNRFPFSLLRYVAEARRKARAL